MAIDKQQIDKKIRYLLKQNRLQGFVSEIEINQLCNDNEEEIELVKKSLIEQDVEINPFVRTSKENKKKHSVNKKSAPTPPQNDTVWTYLNQIGSFPLLSREQEVQYARQMALAKNKMIEGAFRSDVVLDYLISYYIV